MEIIIFFIIVAIALALRTSPEDALRDALAAEGVELGSMKVDWWRGSRYQKHVDWRGTARSTGEPVNGYALVAYYGGRTELFFIRDYDRTRALRDRLAREGEPDEVETSEMDLEQRIIFETNQRLERLMGDREAFLANDTDGDGQVDADEWDAARARIAAEVRSELSSEQPPTAPPAPAESEVVEDELGDAGDGAW